MLFRKANVLQSYNHVKVREPVTMGIDIIVEVLGVMKDRPTLFADQQNLLHENVGHDFQSGVTLQIRLFGNCEGSEI